jgi:excisionase family DNA binding protein
MPEEQKLLLSIQEAAAALAIGRSKTYQLMSEGRLLTVQIGRRRLVRMDSVRAIANGESF